MLISSRRLVDGSNEGPRASFPRGEKCEDVKYSVAMFRLRREAIFRFFIAKLLILNATPLDARRNYKYPKLGLKERKAV
ncbi:hypothetical protein [Roseixanthobacter pseudopolyaromaticivorans]|uniref:hypothetical protein n=1 Tax=Xanthobacteraceae TaxID=335928 RepID=UPI00372ADA6A